MTPNQTREVLSWLSGNQWKNYKSKQSIPHWWALKWAKFVFSFPLFDDWELITVCHINRTSGLPASRDKTLVTCNWLVRYMYWHIYCAIKYIAAVNCISFRTQFRLYLVILLLKYSKEYIIDRRELMYMYTKPDKGYFQCKYLLLHLIWKTLSMEKKKRKKTNG